MMGWGTCIIGRPTQDQGNDEEGKSNPRPMKLHRPNLSPLVNLSRVLANAHQEIYKKSWILNRNPPVAFPWFRTRERVDVQWPKWSGQSQLVDGGGTSTELCQQIMRSAASV